MSGYLAPASYRHLVSTRPNPPNNYPRLIFMSSPKLSIHQCLKEIAAAERKRKLTTRTAVFLRHCVLAHMSPDHGEAQASYDKVLDMVIADLPPGGDDEEDQVAMSHEEIVSLANKLPVQKSTTNVKSSSTNRGAAAFVAVECSDDEASPSAVD